MERQPWGVGLVEHFAALEDARVERTRLHPLLSMGTSAICAGIGAAETWEEIDEKHSGVRRGCAQCTWRRTWAKAGSRARVSRGRFNASQGSRGRSTQAGFIGVSPLL
ncbi:MAG: transposase family protein [Chloroflexi bacterium]|nr:transposase family protein [Chloroflexota bacterium]